MKVRLFGLLSVFFILIFLNSCNMSFDSDNSIDGDDSLSVDTLTHEHLDLYSPMVIPESADELFNDFFYSFLEDEDFRNERIKTDFTNQSLLVKEAYMVIYERESDLSLLKDTTINSVSLEWISWEQKNIEHYRFEREKDGKWYMTSIDEEVMDESPNGTFLSFLRNFMTDEDFQLKSIAQPITFILTPQEEDDALETTLNEEEWLEFRKELPDFSSSVVCINYGQSAISHNRKSIFLEGLSSGFQMKFEFDNIGGEWKLIKIES